MGKGLFSKKEQPALNTRKKRRKNRKEIAFKRPGVEELQSSFEVQIIFGQGRRKGSPLHQLGVNRFSNREGENSRKKKGLFVVRKQRTRTISPDDKRTEKL